MTKRKLKLNILDIVIVVAVICSVGAIIFRDYIGDLFVTPEVSDIEIVVVCEDINQFNKNLFVVSNSLTLVSDDGDSYSCVSKGCDPESKTVTLTMRGYERFKLLFGENGIRFDPSDDMLIKVGSLEYPVTVSSAILTETAPAPEN